MHFSDLVLNLPELSVFLGALLVLLVDLFIPKRWSIITFLLALLTLVISGVFIWSQIWEPVSFSFYHMVVNDSFGTVLKLFIVGITFFVFIYSRRYLIEHKLQQGEYYALALITVLGMLLLVSSNHLLVLYLALEISSLPLYALVAINRDSVLSTEAAMKYYLMGAVSSGVLLYGISLLYGASDSLNIQTIVPALVLQHNQTLVMVSLVFIIGSISFKFGAAPFHMWAPDVYQGAASPISLFISSAPKIAALGMLYRLVIEVFPGFQIDWQKVLIIIAIISIVLGNITAIAQSNIKRMMAYSSIAHMGYTLLGFIAGSSRGYAASVFYMITYAITAAGVFAVITLLARTGLDIGDIKELRGLNTRNPILAFMMLLIMFSMAGIPPVVGFFAKLGVLEALISAHLTWLAVLALIFAVVGSYYYLAIVKVMYFEEPEAAAALACDWDMKVAITINGLVVLGLGLFPSALFRLCQYAILNS
jgi:NADH-quinone oxidoreductase subunit N